MRLLITGASGLLGLNLALEALRLHTVIGVDRGLLRNPPFELLQMDLLHPGSAEHAISRSRADAVIHCAAIADVDACERNPAEAKRVNAELPGRLAAACRQTGASLVQISTDAVFDGNKDGAYTEADEPHPTSTYAATKLEGETAVLAAHPGAVVVRVNFYGWSMSGERSLAEFFVKNLQAGKQVRGFTDIMFCPMYVSDLAGVLLDMLKGGMRGLYHAVGPRAMTKYDFGLEIARRFGYDAALIRPESVEKAGLAAKRAHNLNLSVHKLSTALGAQLPEFSTGLSKFYTDFRQEYPQKLKSFRQAST